MPTFQFGRGERWAVLSAVAYTIVNVTLRAAAPTIDPVLGSLLRQVPLFVIAAAFVLGSGAKELRPSSPEFFGWRIIGALLAAGSVSFVVGNILYFQALNNGGLGVTVSGVQGGSVVGGLWIGFLALRERPVREQVLGTMIIVAGLIQVGLALTSTIGELWWLGLLLAIGAGTTYALSNSLSRYVQRQRPLLFATLFVSSLGGLVPLSAFVAARAVIGETIAVDGPSVLAVLGAGLANAVALASLALAVRSAPVATVNSISSTSIVLSFVASVLLFSETGSPPMIVGVTLVTFGIVVAQARRRPRPAEPGEPPASPATASEQAAGR